MLSCLSLLFCSLVQLKMCNDWKPHLKASARMNRWTVDCSSPNTGIRLKSLHVWTSQPKCGHKLPFTGGRRCQKALLLVGWDVQVCLKNAFDRFGSKLQQPWDVQGCLKKAFNRFGSKLQQPEKPDMQLKATDWSSFCHAGKPSWADVDSQRRTSQLNTMLGGRIIRASSRSLHARMKDSGRLQASRLYRM